MHKKITFVKAGVEHEKLILSWLAEPHMIECWDNSPEHKADILHFIHGRKQHYFAGTTQYFIGLVEGIPFAFLLADILDPTEDLPEPQSLYMSKSGHTIAVDFGIGNKDYLGRGLCCLLSYGGYYGRHFFH